MSDHAQAEAVPLIEARGITVKYGAALAVQDVSLTVHAGEVVALVGVNGAGKTTTLRALCGALPLSGGSVLFRGEQLRRSPAAMLRAGVAHCPEGRHVFPHMTVRENLDLGAYMIKDRALLARRREHMLHLFPALKDRERQAAGTLSGGEQQMLAMGRAMMTGPKLLLLDEPTLGLAPIIAKALAQLILAFREEGTSILLVEESADLTLRVADSMHLMDGGRIVLSGAPDALADTDAMRRLYLGVEVQPNSTATKGAET